MLLSQLVTIVVAILLLFLGWSLFVLWGVGPALGFHPLTITKTTTMTTHPKTTPAPPQQVPETEPVIDYPSQEQSVLWKLQRQEFEAKTTRLHSALNDAERNWKDWRLRVQPLLKNDAGRRLAPAAPQVRFLLSKVPCDSPKLQQLRDDIESVRDHFSQASAPSSDLDRYDRQLTAVESEIRSIVTTFEFLNRAWEELIADSQAVPNGRTLEDALAELNAPMDDEVRRAASEKVRALQRQQEQELQAVTDKLDSLRQELRTAQDELKQADGDAHKKLDEAQARTAALSRELEQKRQAARKNLEEALPAFRDRLAPFLSKGYRQPQTRQQFLAGIESQPMSYAALLRVGALVDDAQGLETLFFIADSNPLRQMNDRPSGAFPQYTSEFDIKKPDVLRELKAVQAFLRQHGEALVEAQLLAP